MLVVYGGVNGINPTLCPITDLVSFHSFAIKLRNLSTDGLENRISLLLKTGELQVILEVY